MKYLKIKLSKDEQDFIFKKMTEMFSIYNSDIWYAGQEIEFDFADQFEIYAKVTLEKVDSEFDENHQADNIKIESVGKFEFNIYQIGEGDPIEYVLENSTFENQFEERIKNYFYNL